MNNNNDYDNIIITNYLDKSNNDDNIITSNNFGISYDPNNIITSKNSDFSNNMIEYGEKYIDITNKINNKKLNEIKVNVMTENIKIIENEIITIDENSNNEIIIPKTFYKCGLWRKNLYDTD